jgi:D-3-phosphoglycerate dehydrogenase
MKSSPEEGGTHGIIGQTIIRHCKPDAVILNFARGELVDSMAMKEFLDRSGEARYISDFPDDELWNHPNTIIVPHLGASTGEAEDSAAVSVFSSSFSSTRFYHRCCCCSYFCSIL